jgi:hypothetical protein
MEWVSARFYLGKRGGDDISEDFLSGKAGILKQQIKIPPGYSPSGILF